MTARLRRSLRARMIASLVLACAITLGAATLVLLLPLAHRLKAAEVAYLRTSARHAAETFSAVSLDRDRSTREQQSQDEHVARQIARLALHGVRRGPFSMRCQWAAAQGAAHAAHYLSRAAMRPIDRRLLNEYLECALLIASACGPLTM